MQQNLDFCSNKASKKALFCFLNEICLIPRNDETEGEFFTRVNAQFPGGLQQIETLLQQKSFCPFPSIRTDLDINVRFLPWVISSRKLRPWHLGVFESDGKSHKIQIHPRAKKKNRLSEVLSHEAVHYLRKDFESSYEELLCYLISKKGLYKHLGFFLVSPEFKISLSLSFVASLLPLWIDFSSTTNLLIVWSSPILFALGFTICRYRLQAPFGLQKQFTLHGVHFPLLLRLEPKEIDTLVQKKSPIKAMNAWAQKSFRWKFLSTLYLAKKPEN